MNFYQEITLLPDAEVSLYFLWSKVYGQLHIALADVRNRYGIDTIGVNFPHYVYEEQNHKVVAARLGDQLRIFALAENDLEKLQINQWLERLSDYVHIKRISKIEPNKVTGYVVVKRYRYPSLDKVALRFAQFRKINFEEARKHCATHKHQAKNYPFIMLKSQSNQEYYKLSIRQENAQESVSGRFNVYGINSATGIVTVPNW